MSDAGAVLAGAFLERCRERGLEPDRRLRILEHPPAPPPRDSSHFSSDETLGELHERIVSGDERRGRGAWYTPAWLAEHLVSRVVTQPSVVADPACGGGVFLVAAAERLATLGEPPEQIVGELLWGADVDAVAVAVAEAELWLWSAGRGSPVVAGGRLVVGDTLTELEVPPVDVVVGNPPFLGQLKRRTSVDADRRRALVERWGDVVRPYTDASWLFLVAAVEAARPGGRVVLVQPESLLGARDAAAVRGRIDATASLIDCWTDDGSTFAASVDVCAPILDIGTDDGHETNDWLAALGEAAGIPAVELPVTGPTVDDLATVVAGFRDEYYGLVDAVSEEGVGLRLVTSGSIDPLCVRDEPVRFAKRRWNRPAVDPAQVVKRAKRWVEVQRAPKVIVASQTKVLEAVVDRDGSLVAGVPAIVVVPDDGDDVWRVAAMLHAPAVSAWMLRRALGTGLSAGSLKPTGALVGALPIPTDTRRWDDAATLARALAENDAGDTEDARARWREFGAVADAAYGIDDPDLRDWWLERLPLR